MSRWTAAKLRVARKRVSSCMAYDIHIFASELEAFRIERLTGGRLLAMTETTIIGAINKWGMGEKEAIPKRRSWVMFTHNG